MPELWTKDKEIEFFHDSLKNHHVEKLFYRGDDSRYYAYWPKSYTGISSTLQSRNAVIGNFTEKYSVHLLQDFAKSRGLYAIQGAICNEIGLTPQSAADVVLSQKQGKNQEAKDITAIFEVKMSIVWNWELRNNQLDCLGDFRTHKGNPGLLRSDSMLKAIGKSITIRVSSYNSAQIPIIILGNTPITENYIPKVDHLFQAGILQGFWSVNPNPLDNNDDNLKQTSKGGFIRMDSYDEFQKNLNDLLSKRQEFFSAMKTRKELGEIIGIASQETDFATKAEKFLSLIRE